MKLGPAGESSARGLGLVLCGVWECNSDSATKHMVNPRFKDIRRHKTVRFTSSGQSLFRWHLDPRLVKWHWSVDLDSNLRELRRLGNIKEVE